jgi:hypothetical protein
LIRDQGVRALDLRRGRSTCFGDRLTRTGARDVGELGDIHVVCANFVGYRGGSALKLLTARRNDDKRTKTREPVRARTGAVRCSAMSDTTVVSMPAKPHRALCHRVFSRRIFQIQSEYRAPSCCGRAANVGRPCLRRSATRACRPSHDARCVALSWQSRGGDSLRVCSRMVRAARKR